MSSEASKYTERQEITPNPDTISAPFPLLSRPWFSRVVSCVGSCVLKDITRSAKLNIIPRSLAQLPGSWIVTRTLALMMSAAFACNLRYWKATSQLKLRTMPATWITCLDDDNKLDLHGRVYQNLRGIQIVFQLSKHWQSGSVAFGYNQESRWNLETVELLWGMREDKTTGDCRCSSFSLQPLLNWSRF